MSGTQITELTIGGFQVFDKPTRIPLGPMTLVFGPNSAGKSAIADALKALAEFAYAFRSLEIHPNLDPSESAAAALDRHWRLLPGDGLALCPELQLGIQLRVERSQGERLQLRLLRVGDKFKEERNQFQWPLLALTPATDRDKPGYDEMTFLCSLRRAEYPMSDGDRPAPLGGPRLGGVAIWFNAVISVANAEILRFKSWSHAAINLAHPALRAHADRRALFRLARRLGSICSLADGWFTLSGSVELLNNGLNMSTYLDVVASDPDIGEVDDASAEALTKFATLFDAVWLCSMGVVYRGASVSLVPASRTIPTTAQVTYLKDHHGYGTSSSCHGIRPEGLAQFDWLATAAMRRTLENLTVLRAPSLGSGADGLTKINRMLAENLFIERGYYIAAEVSPLLPLSPEAAAVVDGKAGDFSQYREFLVTLVLCDPQGRRFAFDEVGSGLGYALPVLIAIAEGQCTFIQQPELHLHPALQSALADAFIANMSDGGQHIVETHSEHLLLRMLKRVRQSQSGVDSANALSLKCEDLVVLYVDPAPDGTSTVKRLRVAHDGDFIDRWPRGFFEERWKDLFDE